MKVNPNLWKLVYFLVVLFFSPNTYSKQVLKIACSSQKPMSWKQGKAIKGINPEIVHTIFKKMKIPIEINILPSKLHLVKEWTTGKYDMILAYPKSSDKEKHLHFSKESHLIQSFNFFRLKDNAKNFDYKNKLDELRGIKIGATRGLTYSNDFWKAKESGVIQVELVTNNNLLMKKLLAKRIDAILYDTIPALYEAKKGRITNKIISLSRPIASTELYYTFVKASKFPNILKVREDHDKILKEMKSNGELLTIYKKYLGNIKTRIF